MRKALGLSCSWLPGRSILRIQGSHWRKRERTHGGISLLQARPRWWKRRTIGPERRN